jgi:hypothetical protein
LAQNSWQSQIGYYNSQNNLVYVADSAGNRLPDFSYAGYKNGEKQIPDIPVVKTISPVIGDNTAHINSALFEVALTPIDSNGYRGALLLSAGEYEVAGTIRITFDGVVLRGEGDGNDPSINTILKAVGNTPVKRTVLVAGGGSSTKWSDKVPGTTSDIISDSVMVGDRSFRVENSSLFSVGDNIVIYHPCTQSWLTEIDSGGTFWYLLGAEPGVDVPWAVGEQPILFNRYITDIAGDTITIDAPVFNHLIRDLSQSYIYKYSRSGIRTHIGIEDIRIDIETQSNIDENHAWNAIDLYQIEDAWVRNCTLMHFGLSGIRTNTAIRITIENCQAIDPVSVIEGGKRYNFNVYNASQLILFKNCHASNGRHHYVSNGTSWTSGCVFVDCTSAGAFASSEGHRRWSTGLLFDNLIELDGPRQGFNPRLLGLYNRGYFGTSHGWSSAHSVAWACDVAEGDLIVQKPPTAQNYAIGCFGNVTGISPPASFPVPEGYIEGTNQPGLEPRSLYYAQLEERLGIPVAIAENRIQTDIKPTLFQLYQNYPNPFNPSTEIRFNLTRPAHVELKILNLLGQEIVTLMDARKSIGEYALFWNGKNINRESVGSGLYLYVLMANDGKKGEIVTRKMLLLR